MRILQLTLPRRYPALALLCGLRTGIDVSCRVESRTIGTTPGTHTAVLRLPNRAGTVPIACTTTAGRFACRVRN
jgi:hypothetical protein